MTVRLKYLCRRDSELTIYATARKGNGMLEKVTMQTTQQFSDFPYHQKNPQRTAVKCRACAVARKIETDCFCTNLPISNDPVVRISRNLAKNSSETK